MTPPYPRDLTGPSPVRSVRRQVAALGAVLLLAVVVTTLPLRSSGRVAERAPTGSVRSVSAPPVPTHPSAGAGTFAFADGGSPTYGRAGPLWRYAVAVEHGSGQDPADFAAAVDATLADGRSWVGSGGLRVRRVADAADADFVVHLATSRTSAQMCATGGLHTEGYTSCRLPGTVIVNLDRWMTAVPGYGAPLAVYRAYVVNHEVGHEFGEGHEACPGPGRPAPVMQQQTYGLAGCVANPWPYPDGARYAGPPVDGV
ncbi:DUF3152 domain-containing protein [Micromonospora nigra]|nr:DUF3152 domain-containing protein [Micromonospora nigra]